MKKIKSTIMGIFIISATFSLIVAANAGNTLPQQTISETKRYDNGNQPLFYAEISFYIYEGGGCGCVPIINVSIYAYGLDTDHNDSGFTDEYGLCILELEYDHTYRVLIEDEEFQNILFDFYVLDDQTFAFHLDEDSPTQNFPVLYNLLQRIEMAIKLIN